MVPLQSARAAPRPGWLIAHQSVARQVPRGAGAGACLAGVSWPPRCKTMNSRPWVAGSARAMIHPRIALVALALSLGSAWASRANADDDKQACVDSYEEAQRLRPAARLSDARSKLRACGAQARTG